jgi:hypothetical protein
MNSKTLTRITAMTLLTLLAIPVRPAAQEQQKQTPYQVRYTITDLGLAADYAEGINNKGWVDFTAIQPDGTWHGRTVPRFLGQARKARSLASPKLPLKIRWQSLLG